MLTLWFHFLQEYYSFQQDLTAPPEGYNSVRGIKSTEEQHSDFEVGMHNKSLLWNSVDTDLITGKIRNNFFLYTQLEMFFFSQDDEYVVYQRSQQRMRYLVEFSLPGDSRPESGEGAEEEEEEVVEEENEEKNDSQTNEG